TNLLRALRMFSDAHGWIPEVTWVGRREVLTEAARAYCDRVDAMLAEFPDVHRAWRWAGERNDVPKLLGEHHALIHSTFHEGLPNAICEALASGLPVLASAVCDNSLLVAEGERGFLFNPSDPATIAAAIERLAGMNAAAWSRMSSAARAYAE